MTFRGEVTMLVTMVAVFSLMGKPLPGGGDWDKDGQALTLMGGGRGVDDEVGDDGSDWYS